VMYSSAADHDDPKSSEGHGDTILAEAFYQ